MRQMVLVHATPLLVRGVTYRPTATTERYITKRNEVAAAVFGSILYTDRKEISRKSPKPTASTLTASEIALRATPGAG